MDRTTISWLQDPRREKGVGLEFCLVGLLPYPFPQAAISFLFTPRTPWPGTGCSLAQKSNQSIHVQSIELHTSVWIEAGKCLGDGIRSRGTSWQGHLLLRQARKISGDKSASDSYYLILLFVSGSSSLRSPHLSLFLPTYRLQPLCPFFLFQSESGKICLFLVPEA